MFTCEICENEYDDKRRRECHKCSSQVCEYCINGEECIECNPEDEEE
jgi:hypothetical protein